MMALFKHKFTAIIKASTQEVSRENFSVGGQSVTARIVEGP